MVRDFQRELTITTNRDLLRKLLSTNIPSSLFQENRSDFGWFPEKDVIILSPKSEILKSSINLSEKDISTSLTPLLVGRIAEWKLGNEHYLIYRVTMDDRMVFFTRNIEALYEFFQKLGLFSLAGWLFSLLVLYRVSLRFAQMSFSPIKKQNKSLEAFSRNVAHELRTPLSVLSSNLELIELTHDPKLIISSKEEILSMERIIETLLFVSNPKKEQLQITEISIRSILKHMQSLYGTDHIDIHFREDMMISSNYELFSRVCTNLIENALKYSTDKKISIRKVPGGIAFENKVEATIPKEEVEKLTSLFYQRDTSRASSGYGLGLALVAKIVDILDWKLRIRSEDAHFEVTLIFEK